MTAPFGLRDSGIMRRALKTYLVALSSLWTVAILIVSLRRFVLHRAFPLNSLFLSPGSRFWDFTVYAPRFAVWGQGDRFFTLPGFPFDYPPPVVISELAYYKLSDKPLYAYLATVILFAVAGALLVAMAVPKRIQVRPLAIAAALATAIFSYPLFFLLERANIEGVVWMASSLGLLFFACRRFTWSAIFLALATAMKLFPGPLLLLLLAKRRYRDFCLALAAFAAFTYGSLWLTGPSPLRAAQGIVQGMDHLRQDQVLHFIPPDVGFDHSIWSLVKQVLHRWNPSDSALNALLPRIYLIYGLFALAFFAAAYLSRIRYLPVLNQMLALSALSVLLPFVSFDYTLVHMFAPFSILLLVLAADVSSGRLRLTYQQILFLLLPFAILFTPQSYLVVSIVGYDGQVKALALLALIAASASIPLPSSMFSELPERQTLMLNLRLRSPELSEGGREDAPEYA
jgi:hypothetical protein